MLVPFEGYILSNDQPEVDTLLIDPDVSTASRAATPQVSKGADVSWSIRIVARQGQARDTDNRAAVAGGASRGWDVLDRPEPPVVGDYVSVSFPHLAWGRNTARYSTDARPSPVEGERWELELRTRRPGRVALRFEGLETVPTEYEIWLVDEELQTQHDLRAQPVYAVAGAGEGVAKRLTLVVGRRSFVEGELAATQEVPVRPALFQNYS